MSNKDIDMPLLWGKKKKKNIYFELCGFQHNKNMDHRKKKRKANDSMVSHIRICQNNEGDKETTKFRNRCLSRK